MTKLFSQDCLQEISESTYNPHFILSLDTIKMKKFKEEVIKLSFKYFDIKDRIRFVTLPDSNGIVRLEIAFPNYPADRYKYFYPKKDLKYYFPENISNNIMIEPNKKINPNKLKLLIEIIRNDINSKLNPAKFNYWFADAREAQFKTKEWSSGCIIYSDEMEIIGRVHKFSGNMTFSGHTECDKIDFGRITYYKEPNDDISFINLKQLEIEATLPLKLGKVFFRKIPVDYERLEFCQLIDFMSEYCITENGEILMEL